MVELVTGAMWGTGSIPDTLPSWQRNYYSLLMLETLRTKSILVPFCSVKEDFAAANSGVITFTEVFDTEPNTNALTESSIWLTGAHLDSRSVNLTMEIHGDILKFSDYSEVVQFVNRGDMRGLVRDKIGQNQVDYLDILARNAFLAHPNPTYINGRATRVLLTATDLFDPDIAETVRVHLEENEIPGVTGTADGDGQTIVCVTSPRVIKDIRTSATSKWLEVQEYAGGARKFNSEVGTWNGIRFVRTNRLALRNYGIVHVETALNGATIVGQGANASVDGYVPGQTGSTRTITVTSSASFAVGDYITISAVGSHLTGTPPVETDGTQETRRIVSIPGGGATLTLNKPLMKPHASTDWVTHGLDLHASLFMGGPAVVYGVAERPHPINPPKYDDLMILNRYGWRGFLKFQQFRPEFYELVLSAGSTD
jgi:N4-gp56 family major capsid protein